MSNYRRLYIPGGTFFFTLVGYRRKPIFADNVRVDQLRRSFRGMFPKKTTRKPFDSDYCIRKLEASDTVQNFKVGNQSFLPLKTFLQKQAKQFQQSSIAQTYVVVTDDKTIIGFVSLTCSEIDLQNGYDLADCSHANNYEFLPAAKIARLAVDNRYRNSGIGSTL